MARKKTAYRYDIRTDNIVHAWAHDLPTARKRLKSVKKRGNKKAKITKVTLSWKKVPGPKYQQSPWSKPKKYHYRYVPTKTKQVK